MLVEVLLHRCMIMDETRGGWWRRRRQSNLLSILLVRLGLCPWVPHQMFFLHWCAKMKSQARFDFMTKKKISCNMHCLQITHIYSPDAPGPIAQTSLQQGKHQGNNGNDEGDKNESWEQTDRRDQNPTDRSHLTASSGMSHCRPSENVAARARRGSGDGRCVGGCKESAAAKGVCALPAAAAALAAAAAGHDQQACYPRP